MSSPLVAIVTPVYNGAEFIEETLQCVQAQTYPNLVHVILNNASTDDTPAIIDRYRNGRVPLMVFRNEATVPSMDNWNKALTLVPEDATYVRILCADDTITPDAVQRTVELAETDPEIGVVGSHHIFGDYVDPLLWPTDRDVFDKEEAVRMVLMREGMIMPPHVLMRKAVLKDREPFFRPPLKNGFDLDAMLDILRFWKFGFIHDNLAFTRLHENSVTSSNNMLNERGWHYEGLHFLTSYGPSIFGDNYRSLLKQFKNYYVRRILVWRKEDGGLDNTKVHLDALRKAGWTWSPLLVAQAMLDWALIKARLRRNWTGYPGWQ